MSVVHIEVEQYLDSKLSKSDIQTAVMTELRKINCLSLGSKFETFTNELLSNHVKHITFGEFNESNRLSEPSANSQISINDATTRLHIYRLEQEHINSEFLNVNSDGDSESIPAAKHCVLPSVHFDGIWESLIFDQDIKEELLMYTTSAMLFSKRQVDQNIININKVLLLYGPPGTGKTSLCKGLAQKLSIRFSELYRYTEFIEINSHSLFSKYYSESGKLVMNMFAKIKEHLDNGESLVFVLIDEIESLTHARDACMSGAEPSDSIRVVNAILTQLDSIRNYPNVIILTTSNLKNAVDAAFIDRVDMQIFIDTPGTESIYSIYLSCIRELLRVGLIENGKVIKFFPVHSLLISEFERSEKVTDEVYLHSASLLELSRISNGLSGRTLRKIPFLAYGTFTQMDSNNLSKFIESMKTTVQHMKHQTNAKVET